jgi:hypothetical protein
MLIALTRACSGRSHKGLKQPPGLRRPEAYGRHRPPGAGGTLTVWVDSTRLAAAQLYQRNTPRQFSQEAIWAAIVTPGLNTGKAIVSMLPAWQKAIVNYASSDRYQVRQ